MSDFLIKPRPILSDMPDHIKQKIVNHLELMARFNARCCSKEFKRLVYESPICYPSLIVKQKRLGMEVSCYFERYEEDPEEVRENDDRFVEGDGGLEKLSLRFHRHRDGYWKENMKYGYRRVVPAVEFLDAGIAHFTSFVGNPKVSFGNFTLKLVKDDERRHEFLEIFNDSLLTLTHKIDVKELILNNIQTEGDFLNILSHLVPGTLQNLEIQLDFHRNRGNVFQLDAVAELPHWRHLKSFQSSWLKMDLPYGKWSHFENFKAHILRLTIEMVKGVIENFRQNPAFISSIITFDSMDQEILPFLQKFEFKNDNYIVNVSRDGSQFRVDMRGRGIITIDRNAVEEEEEEEEDEEEEENVVEREEQVDEEENDEDEVDDDVIWL